MTLGAEAPVHHFGFVDDEVAVVDGDQTRCIADGAVHVDQTTARPADEMVVVVAHPGLESRGRSGWLDTAKNALLDQDAEGVVDSLS